MLVDDDALNLKTLELSLTKLGVSFESAFNGQQAVDKVKLDWKKYGLIVMDY